MIWPQVVRLASLVILGLIIADFIASKADPGGGSLLANIGGLWSQSIGGLMGQQVNVPSTAPKK